MKRLTILACAFMLLTACGAGLRSRTDAVLDDVESFINERADSALAVLQGVDSAALTTRALRARYSLLRTMAQATSYRDLTVPGLIDDAAAWYDRHGSADDRMKALYYQGCIAQANGDQNKAAVYYSRAEEFADRVMDKHTLGLLYLAKATVYGSVYNIEKERQYIEKGLSVFQADNDPMQEMALGQLASTYFASRDWERADTLFRKGITSSKANAYAMSVYLSNYARMKLLQPDPEPEVAIELLDRKRSEYGYPLSLQDAGAYAYALTLSGKDSEAKEILEQVEHHADSYSQEVVIWFSRCALASGDYKRAYESLSQAKMAEEKLIQNILADSVSDAISSYHDLSARQDRMQYKISIAVLIIILLLLCLALLLARLRRNKLESERSRVLDVCSILEKEAAENETKTIQLQSQLSQFREIARQERILRFRQAGRLQTSIWRLDRRGPSWIRRDSELAAIRKELSLVYDIDDSGEKLSRRLDRDLDGKIIPLLELLNIQNKPQEQLFLCCCLLDLPAEMIADKFGITANNVRVKKHRLRDQIAKLNNADYDALFDIRR